VEHVRCFFSKRQRIRRNADFRRIYEAGRRLVGPLFIAWVLDTPAQPRAVGVVTSRKIGDAVARNRARRLLREAYRQQQPNLADHFQLVMVARTTINGKSYADVAASFRDVMRAAGHWREA
jgi:ribonuclease P protein component